MSLENNDNRANIGEQTNNYQDFVLTGWGKWASVFRRLLPFWLAQFGLLWMWEETIYIFRSISKN